MTVPLACSPSDGPSTGRGRLTRAVIYLAGRATRDRVAPTQEPRLARLNSFQGVHIAALASRDSATNSPM